MKIFIIIPLTITLLFGSGESFSKSKKQLVEIYKDHQQTFYCGCNYSYTNKGNMIDRKSCGYVPRNAKTKKGKDNVRARRIEWEHVMPAQNFGRHLPCWKEGGRKNCSKVSEQFRKMEADKMNLVPAIGELNGDRSNFRYGALEPQKVQYGECSFQVDFKARKAYIDPQIRGDVARIYLYMSDTYDIPLSKQERRVMQVWNKLDPIDEWEKKRQKRIQRF